MESRKPTPACYRLRELIVHARDGSPIALAAVVGFVERKLQQISPQMVLSFAERILENCESDAPTVEKVDKQSSTNNHALQPWPRGDQAECSAANASKLDTPTKGRKKNVPRSSPDRPHESPASLRRVSR